MATYAEQMREADRNAARAAAGAAGNAGTAEWRAAQQRQAGANAAQAANAASRGASWAQSPAAAPFSDPWGSGGLPNWQAPTNTERTWETAPGYRPTQAPGAWEDVRGEFTTPSRAEETSDVFLDRMLKNPPQFSSNVQQEYDQFQRPDIATDPGLDPYYENAKRRAAESINTAMGARGAYGSSAANDMISEAFTNLEAQRANREADYNLQRLQEQRAWEGMAGNLAQAADQQTVNNVLADANVMSLATQIAQTGDTGQMARLQQYLETSFGLDQQQSNWFVRVLTGATAADTQAGGRGDRAFSGTMGVAGAISGIMGEDYQAGFGSDQEMFLSFLEAMYGPDYLELMGGRENRERIENDFQRLLDLAGELGI